MSTATTILTLMTATLAPGQEQPEPVTRRDVSFQSAGVTLAGHLYLPGRYDGSEQLAGVVVTGAWTTVKEQMPATYAIEMAGRGFAALTFDFRGWGASGGTPRFLEDPETKTQDIVAAAAFLAARPEIDAARVAGLGVCASSGYMSDATLRSPDLRALGLVAPWLHDAAIAEAVYGGAEGVAKLIQAGRAAAASSEPVLIEAASSTNENSLMYQAPYYTEADRGLVETYDNQWNVASWEPWLTYDAVKIANQLKKPTLAVHSQAAVIPQGITEFARRMGERAEVLWLEDVSQFDFYDQPGPVGKAADAVAEHFHATFREQVDVAAVTSIVQGVGTLADLGQFEALEELYAEEVRVDYSSLSGEPASTMTAAALMTSWSATLPGFDRTRHDVTNVYVQVDGAAAVATADVSAEHFLGALYWQARGSYRYELAKRADGWRIHAHTFSLTGESGTRDIFAVASQRAQASPSRYLKRQQTEDAVRMFLESLESKDMQAFASVWADDAVQELPYAPEGFPKIVRGKQALIEHYAAWPKNSGAADFTSELRFFPMQDAEWVFATFTGNVDVIPTGRKYNHVYGGLFHVTGGKITLFREYFDPAPFRYAFGLDD